jgi:hypothetical protein
MLRSVPRLDAALSGNSRPDEIMDWDSAQIDFVGVMGGVLCFSLYISTRK